jgi:hypothetical protein
VFKQAGQNNTARKEKKQEKKKEMGRWNTTIPLPKL